MWPALLYQLYLVLKIPFDTLGLQSVCPSSEIPHHSYFCLSSIPRHPHIVGGQLDASTPMPPSSVEMHDLTSLMSLISTASASDYSLFEDAFNLLASYFEQLHVFLTA